LSPLAFCFVCLTAMQPVDYWACGDCTFHNNLALQECEMCGAVRRAAPPAAPTPPSPPANDSETHSSTDDDGAPPPQESVGRVRRNSAPEGRRLTLQLRKVMQKPGIKKGKKKKKKRTAALKDITRVVGEPLGWTEAGWKEPSASEMMAAYDSAFRFSLCYYSLLSERCSAFAVD
jgi:hypothetical protein